MKKVLTIALMAALALSSTSCLNTDSDDNEVKAQVYMYNMISDLNDDSAPLSMTQSYSNFTFNYTKSTLQADVMTMLPGGLTGRFNTGDLKMVATESGYNFNLAGAAGTGLVIEDFKGLFEPNLGVITFDYKLNSDKYVHSLSSFSYNFTKCVAKNIETGVTELENENETAFLLNPDNAKKTLSLGFYNLILAGVENKVQKVDYIDIPYEMDLTGFKANVKDEIKCTQGYTDCVLSNLVINVNSYGQRAYISFDLNKRHYEFNGHIFYQKS